MLPGKRSGIFTAAVKRGVAPHTRKQRFLAAISKLRSAFFTGYKNKICTYQNLHVLYIYICDSRLNRPESVLLASLARQLQKTFSNDKAGFYNRGSGVALKFTPTYWSFHFANISMCHKNYIASYNNSQLQTIPTKNISQDLASILDKKPRLPCKILIGNNLSEVHT